MYELNEDNNNTPHKDGIMYNLPSCCVVCDVLIRDCEHALLQNRLILSFNWQHREPDSGHIISINREQWEFALFHWAEQCHVLSSY